MQALQQRRRTEYSPEAIAARLVHQNHAEIFDRFVRKGPKALTYDDWATVKATMSTTTGSQGGFSVPTLVVEQVQDFMKIASPVRSVAGVFQTTAGGPLSVPTNDDTGTVGEQIAENITATAADPVFGSAPINSYKYSSKIVTVPIELLNDSTVDLDPWLAKKFATRIGRASNAKFTTGTGTGEPLGFVTAGTVGKVGTTGQTLTIIYDDLVDVLHSVDAMYRAEPGCCWMVNDTLYKAMHKMKDSAGLPILPEGGDGKVLGYELVVNNDLAAPGANAKSLAFGWFGGYRIRDAKEMEIFRFEDSVYTKLGQVGFLAWARMGGTLADTKAISLYQHSAT